MSQLLHHMTCFVRRFFRYTIKIYECKLWADGGLSMLMVIYIRLYCANLPASCRESAFKGHILLLMPGNLRCGDILQV
jgi:hypothetical protein